MLTIQSTGLVTSLGHGVVESAAAARAGIVRAAPIEGLVAVDGDGEEVAVNGHAVRDLTEGTERDARWLQLAEAALRDLFREQAPVRKDELDPARTALMLVLPELLPERFGVSEEARADLVKTTFVEPLAERSGLQFAFDGAWISYGHSGVARALRVGKELLAAGKHDRLLILAVDSLLDAQSLAFLGAAGRIKGGNVAVGTMPGEAAACVLVGSDGASGVTVGAVFHEDDVAPPLAERVEPIPAAMEQGKSLGRLLAQALEPTPGASVSVDMNGEVWRSHVWGNAKMTASETADLSETVDVFPCVSFGDIGAVTALAAVCLYEQSVARGYARGDGHVIACAGEDGSVATIGLRSGS